ncbi:MAG TPA: hypothetical protein VFJ56_06790 [Nitrospira sp.]|nr:hypothetical protein [Nitrospira sp.]
MKVVFGVLSSVLMVALYTANAAAEMPDVLGVQLGMPVRDAHAKLQAQLPKNKIQVMSDTLPTIDKPVLKSFSSAPVEQIMMGMEGDHVTVNVTLPPNKQAVWSVTRQHFFANKGIPKTTLLASLREKYGKETLANYNLNKPVTDDSQIQTLLWLFDEQGRPAPLPSKEQLRTCLGLEESELGNIEVYANLYRGKDSKNDWCYSSWNVVVVAAVESMPELYGQMRVVAASLALALRASEATSKWKKDIAEGEHRQDIEKAKQQEKPKL